MTGNPATKSDKESASALLVPVQSPRCELLFEAFQGELGSVHLGRMLSGTDAGRVVALRELAERPSTPLTLAVERARGLVSPRLQKTLGVLRVDGTWFLASEYISGVALSELRHALINREERLELGVALRITLDMLNAAIAAREQLSSLGADPVRCLHPESVWLADFGETFLSEVLTSAILLELTRVEDIPSSLGTPESQDAREAGLRLLELSTGSTAPSSLEDPRLPARVREIAARATGRHGAARYTTLQAFADAIGELEPSLVGSEEDVSLELQRLLGPMLEIRRQKLTMSERGALQAGNADETKFFRAESRPMQRETARPPASDTQTGSAHSEAHPIVAPSPPSDHPTKIFRRPAPSDDFHDVTEASRRDAGSLAPAPLSSPTRVSAELTPRDSLPAVARSHIFSARRVLVLCVLLLALAAFGATSGPNGALGASLRWIQHIFGAISG